MVSKPPTPSQRENDSAIDPSVGTHTRAMCSAAGTPTITASTIRSRLVSLRPRRRGLRPAGAVLGTVAIGPRQPTKMDCFCFSIELSRLVLALVLAAMLLGSDFR